MFYLDSNGVTIKCSGCSYEIRDMWEEFYIPLMIMLL